MNSEDLWNKILKRLSEQKEEVQTKTGLWFLASTAAEFIIIDKAVINAPSCNLANSRIITREEFLDVQPYYLGWVNGNDALKQIARDKSLNTSYIFALIEFFTFYV